MPRGLGIRSRDFFISLPRTDSNALEIKREYGECVVLLYRVTTTERVFYKLSAWEDTGRDSEYNHSGRMLRYNRMLGNVSERAISGSGKPREIQRMKHCTEAIGLCRAVFPELEGGVSCNGRLEFEESYIESMFGNQADAR